MRAVNNGPLTMSGGRLVLDTVTGVSTSLNVDRRRVPRDSRRRAPAVLGRIDGVGRGIAGRRLERRHCPSPAHVPAGTSITIIDKTSAGPVTGTFDGLPEGATVVSGENQAEDQLCRRRRERCHVDPRDQHPQVSALRRRDEYVLHDRYRRRESHADTRPARLDFFPTGGGVVSVDLTLAPFSRSTVRVNDIPALAAAEFSTEVRSLTGVPLLVERTMAWDAATGYGAHTEHAVEALGTNVVFRRGRAGILQDIPAARQSAGHAERGDSGVSPRRRIADRPDLSARATLAIHGRHRRGRGRSWTVRSEWSSRSRTRAWRSGRCTSGPRRSSRAVTNRRA